MSRKLIAAIKNRVLEICRRETPSEWRLDEYQRVFEKMLAESIVEAGIDESEIKSLVNDSYQEAIASAAASLLAQLKKRWPNQLRNEMKQEAGFRKRTYARWKDGIDLLRMMLVISHEVGARFNELHRPHAANNDDYQFEALVNLHAQAIRVSREIVTLLEAGYPDGALSRWRTLHEIATIMTFLRHCDDVEVAERFLLHRRVVACKALEQYREYQDRARLDPIADDELEDARRAKTDVIDRFGSEMNSDYGWAAHKLGRKRPTLFDLEKHVGLDHWRPRFKWACDDIHGSYRTIGTTLGEAESVSPVLLAGASNSAFTDPAHMMSISLNMANAALLREAPTVDLLAILSVLESLANDVGSAFLDIEARTTRE